VGGWGVEVKGARGGFEGCGARRRGCVRRQSWRRAAGSAEGVKRGGRRAAGGVRQGRGRAKCRQGEREGYARACEGLARDLT
jgi:hypothetical protein